MVGASGSGKTTLLYLLGLLTEPTAGAYRLGGRAVGQLSDRERSAIRGREIGFVFQSFHLVPQLSVVDNVFLAARYTSNGMSDAAAHRRSRRGVDQCKPR